MKKDIIDIILNIIWIFSGIAILIGIYYSFIIKRDVCGTIYCFCAFAIYTIDSFKFWR